ncbi:Repeat domain-containing protein [Nannocystis exedens]|uniref:Repeat domain-containing protein n=2 Tax=Nannocystis exedens TaxID=54 RepID=A0A1I2GQE4_9BACT|nr:lipoprotein [Nannocystis exedens]SFF19835.1 Repeat domain-containing protein [Nannocystis exedens]
MYKKLSSPSSTPAPLSSAPSLGRPPQRLLWALLTLLPNLSACEPDDGAEEGVPSWEEFRAQVTPVADQDDVWIVEGDMLVQSEASLRYYYDTRVAVAKPRAWVELENNDFDDIHDVGRKLALTYCVSDEFVTQYSAQKKAEVVAWMHTYTADWERAADVNFVYRPEFDATCTGPSNDAWYAVRPTPGLGGACAAGGFPFPAIFQTNREILLAPPLLNGSIGCSDIPRIMRHELGHVLGLQHEHTHPGVTDPVNDGDDCEPDSGPARPLSEFDSYSVMAYKGTPQGCNNDPLATLSRRDAAGVGLQYNLAWEGWHASSHQYSKYDANSTKDIYWYRPSNMVGDTMWWGQANGTFLSANVPSPATGTRLRPVVGNFAGDARQDIFFFGAGSEQDPLFIRTGADGTPGFTAVNFTMGGLFQPLVGNFAGTANTDIFWYGPGWITHFLWKSLGASASPYFDQYAYTFGTPTDWYVPVVGNFDGTSGTDIFFYNSDTDAANSVWLKSLGGGMMSPVNIDHEALGLLGTFSTPYFYTPLTGDFNGDGKVDIFWYAPGQATSGRFWGGGASGPGTLNVVANAPAGTYKPYVGDFNGDGKSDIVWLDHDGDMDQVWWMGANFTKTVTTIDLQVVDASLVLGLLTADNRTDIYAYDLASATDRIWTGNADNTFTLAGTVPHGEGYPVGYGRR